MTMRTFDSPVYVRTGNTLIKEIWCLEDALEFLYDWPADRRGAIYETAVRACQSVIEHDYPLSDARAAFVGFVKSIGALEAVDTRAAWAVPSGQSSGGTTA